MQEAMALFRLRKGGGKGRVVTMLNGSAEWAGGGHDLLTQQDFYHIFKAFHSKPKVMRSTREVTSERSSRHTSPVHQSLVSHRNTPRPSPRTRSLHARDRGRSSPFGPRHLTSFSLAVDAMTQTRTILTLARTRTHPNTRQCTRQNETRWRHVSPRPSSYPQPSVRARSTPRTTSMRPFPRERRTQLG